MARPGPRVRRRPPGRRVPRWRGRRGRRGRRRAGRDAGVDARAQRTPRPADRRPAGVRTRRGRPGRPSSRRAAPRSAAGPPRSRPAPGRASPRPAFDVSWAGVAAPDSATSTHGFASTAARATTSAPVPASRGGGRDRRLVEQPAVRERLLHDDPPPRVVRLRERGARRRLEEVPGRLDAGERVDAVDATSSAARITSDWRGPLTLSPMTRPSSERRRASSASTPASARMPLSSVAEWTWYRRSHGPRSTSDSGSCARSIASEWSLTSWTGASIRHSPTYR